MANHRAVGNPMRVVRAVPIVFITLFFAWPIGHMMVAYLRPGAIADVVSDHSLHAVAWFTLWQATLSTALALAIGLPLTWAVSRWHFRGSRALTGIVSAAFLVPAVTMAAGVSAFVPSRGIPAILWTHVAFNIAVVVRIVGPRWAALDVTQCESATSLGATPWRVFADVTWPAISAAVRGAAALVFAFCFSSFAAVTILGGPTIRTLETEVFTRAIRLGDVRTATALSLVQTLAVMVVFALGRGRTRDAIESVDLVGAQRLHMRRRLTYAPPLVATACASIVVAPMVAIFLRSVRTNGQWTLAGWRALFDGSLTPVGIEVMSVLRTSIVFAAVTAVVTVALAAMACRRIHPGATEGLALIPVMVSAVTLGLGLTVTFDASPFDWRGRAWLIPVVHAVVALPLAVRTIGPVLRGIGSELLESAADLGADPFRIWWSVQFPMLRPALLRAGGISAAVSLGEFGATSFLTRADTMTVPIAIGQLMTRPGPLLQQAAFALAALTVAGTAALLSRV